MTGRLVPADGPFFITGLPRSRTAWLAVLATTGDAICHHEPGLADFDGAERLWSGPSRVGIADAGLGLHIGRIMTEIAPRTLIVEREPAAVVASFVTYWGGLSPVEEHRVEAAVSALHDALKSAAHPHIMRVPFESLNDQDVVLAAMDWLGVQPLNLPQMMHMNVQVDPAFVRARLAALKGME